MDTITLVTGLWDIGRDTLSPGWDRKYDHYLECFEKLLTTDCNLIVYGDEQLKQFVSQCRDESNTQFELLPKEYFARNMFYKQIDKIRRDSDWLKQASWLNQSPQAALDLYNPIVLHKLFLIIRSLATNKFTSSYLFWIDAGLANTVNPDYLQSSILDKLRLIIDKCLFVCFPYQASTEIHGFDYERMCEITKMPVTSVARGGFFGGTTNHLLQVATLYGQLLYDTLYDGYMGTEESLFSILARLYPQNIQCTEIDSNGLLVTFFENLKNDRIKFVDYTK